MGFRVLADWNKAAMAKHLWAIALKADTLWIKWIHSYLIKDQCMWTMPTPGSASWTTRKIFKLRPVVQNWITYLVGNGCQTFLWLDNWHPLGPLFAKFGSRVLYNLGHNMLAKVASIIGENQQWHWPRQRNPVTREIVANTPASFLPNMGQEDSIVWNLESNGRFSIFSA